MRRYWINKEDKQTDRVNFDGDIFHHIFDVCRQQVGSKFEVLCDDSKAYLVEVIEVGKKSASARVLEERLIAALPRPHIHLALSLSRFPVMDAVIEKAVEMGVHSLHPFFSDFSFLRKGEKLSSNKTERWDKIARSATQQCGRGEIMKITEAQTFEGILKQINPSQGKPGLFAYEGSATGGSSIGIRQYLQQLKKNSPTDGPQEMWIIVGSEGGFSHQEVEKLMGLDLQPVTLGPQILRVETACIALVSALKYEFDMMG